MSNDPQLPQPLRVFLCHSSGDKEAVRALYRRLREDGVAPWLDEEEMLPGQDWEHEITKAVRTVDAVIVCLSQESVSKTGYVQKEIRFALDKADEQPEGVIFIIPLKLEPCEVPYRLRRWHWVNYFEPQGHERLLRALRSRATKFDVQGTVSLSDASHQNQIEKKFGEKPTASGSDLLEPAHVEQAGAIKPPVLGNQVAATSDIPGATDAVEAPPQLSSESTTDHSPSGPLSLEQPPLGVSPATASSIKLKASEAVRRLRHRTALSVFAVIVFLLLSAWAILHRRAANQPASNEGRRVESTSSNPGEVTPAATNSSSTADPTGAASPGDTPVASGAYSNWVYKQTLSGHSAEVWSVAFSPDSKTLATGSWDHTVKLWDAHTGTLKRKLDHGGTVYRIAFSPDGQTLASAGWRSVVKLWDAQSGTLTRTIGYRDSGYSWSVAFSPDGMLLGVGNDSSLNFWDMRTHQNVRMSKGHIDLIYIIAFSPDGKSIASAGSYKPNELGDNFIELWDVETGVLKQTLTGGGLLIWYLAFSPDGKMLAGKGNNGGIKLWDVQTGAVIKTYKDDSTDEPVAFSPDGKTLASGTPNIKLWDVQSGALLQTLTTSIDKQQPRSWRDKVHAVAFSPDGQMLAEGYSDGTIRLWVLKI